MKRCANPRLDAMHPSLCNDWTKGNGTMKGNGYFTNSFSRVIAQSFKVYWTLSTRPDVIPETTWFMLIQLVKLSPLFLSAVAHLRKTLSDSLTGSAKTASASWWLWIKKNVIVSLLTRSRIKTFAPDSIIEIGSYRLGMSPNEKSAN